MMALSACVRANLRAVFLGLSDNDPTILHRQIDYLAKNIAFCDGIEERVGDLAGGPGHADGDRRRHAFFSFGEGKVFIKEGMEMKLEALF